MIFFSKRKIFIHRNVYENIICEIRAILSREPVLLDPMTAKIMDADDLPPVMWPMTTCTPLETHCNTLRTYQNGSYFVDDIYECFFFCILLKFHPNFSIWYKGLINNQGALVNSLWPGDAIWRHGTRSTLAQVMACCLTAPSHYLNQCWLIIGEVPWNASVGIIIRRCEDTNQ